MRVGRQGMAGLAYGYGAGAYVRARLRRIASSGRTVLVGPWVSEVGFELLYWVPFLRWAVSTFGLRRERLIAVSRGGAHAWYADLCARYLDVFDAVSLEEFRAGNTARLRRTRGQKQMVATAFDRMLLRWAGRASGAGDALILHPALMYNLFRPFWWGAASTTWVRRHATFGPLGIPAATTIPDLPLRYVALKLYFNKGFPPTAKNRDLAAEIVARVRAAAPVVLLTTGLEVDEHWDYATEGVMTLSEVCTPRNNLEVQSAVIASAQAFVGTYGGFSYLAPSYGVPTVAVYTDARRFYQSHLSLAQEVYAGTGWSVLDLSSQSPGAIDAALGRVIHA